MQVASWQNKHKSTRRTRELRNPIRAIVEKEFNIPKEPPVPLLNFSIGDIKKANGYPIADQVQQAIEEVVKSGDYNSYTPSNGALAVRQAIADHYATPKNPFTAEEVFVTSGATEGIINTLRALCEEGDNVLLPRPGFPLAIQICHNINVEYRFYDLLPDQNWEVDLA